jgi:aspartyl/asparaginyl-tRNA synthetase
LSVFSKKEKKQEPTAEELIKQSFQQIREDLQDQYPVFGVELKEIMSRPKEKKVPRMYKTLCDFIRSEGMEVEGIFRLSGSDTDRTELQYIFNSLGDADLSLCKDVHTASSLLKQVKRIS